MPGLEENQAWLEEELPEEEEAAACLEDQSTESEEAAAWPEGSTEQLKNDPSGNEKLAAGKIGVTDDSHDEVHEELCDGSAEKQKPGSERVIGFQAPPASAVAEKLAEEPEAEIKVENSSSVEAESGFVEETENFDEPRIVSGPWGGKAHRTQVDQPAVESSNEEGEREATAAQTAGNDSRQQPKRPSQVQHDKAQLRSLTREEKELYGPFIQNKAARQRLVTAIDTISMAAYTGNVIVTGDEGMDTMTLAKNMVREIQMNDSNFTGKTAKISGEALNKKDVSAILQQLKNGALIVQKASGMSRKTAENLYKGLQNENLGIVVILEDTKKAANRFLAANKELEECFNARMDLEALSNESLVAFGRKYARELEYSIDELGVLALHTRIEDMQTSDHAVTVMEVKDIVDEAIRRASKKSMGHFFDVLLAKRYDDEDMIILREKDFV